MKPELKKMLQFSSKTGSASCLDFITGFFIILLVIDINGVEAENSYPAQNDRHIILDSALQPYRTGFHFQPPKNWMNDPNGPMYYKGIYHLFYQYNPDSAAVGNITWGHSISHNLVDWTLLEPALKPTESYDLGGCWSGSITFLPGEIPVILYTGRALNNSEVQCLAFPKNLSDPLLVEWVKSDRNPLLTNPKGIEPDQFRDPTTAWQGKDKLWRMIIGSAINGHGAALLYKSKDFLKWSMAKNPFHSSNKTTDMWECPDFFPVRIDTKDGLDNSVEGEGTKHVLKASFNMEDHYVIGDYDSDTDDFIVDTDFLDLKGDLRYDYGMFYASKAFYDSYKKRRVLWGWILEADNQSDDIQRGWAGLQSFPRSIWLDQTRKKLMQWPIQEIEKLRENETKHQNKEIKEGTHFEILDNITASQADIEVSFHLPNLHKAEVLASGILDPQILCSNNNASIKGVFGPFGLLALASKDLTEYTAIYFRIYRRNENDYIVLLCSDQSKSSLATDYSKPIYGAFVDVDPTENISLRTLIDHSIIESFGGEGRACITARVYPELAINEGSHLYVFNYGEESVTISNLNAWSLNNAHIFPAQSFYSSHNEL